MKLNLSFFIFSLCLLSTAVFVSAQTIVSGDVSGIWDNDGSPYLLIDDCTVQTGDELVIEPGVEVVFGDSISLFIYGKILAVGTLSEYIIFRAVNNNAKYERIHLKNGSGSPPISEFKYCDFMNAQIGLYIHAAGHISNINAYTTLETHVSNCRFDSSVSTAIFIRAQGIDASQYQTPRRLHAKVNPEIRNCIFNDNESGIEMLMQGDGVAWYSNGHTDAIIQNNAFINLAGSAINMLPGLGPAHSASPYFINNTIVNCSRAIWIQDGNFDATTKNNIFYATDTVIERTGDNSSTTFYNCFYGNEINFVGYTSTYGDIVMVNSNSDSCDIGFNIFLSPLFANFDDYLLSLNSPCIDAGDPDEQYNDLEDPLNPGFALPPARGTVRNDMGAYGGDYPLNPYLIVNVEEIETNNLKNFMQLQNHPNPFNHETTISYFLRNTGNVRLTIVNSTGQIVSSLVNNEQFPGIHKVRWDGTDDAGNQVSNGFYLYTLHSGNMIESKKMLLLR